MQLQTFGKTISTKWLLAIHLIIPVLLLIWWIDVTYFQKSLLPYMSPASTFLPLYLLIFDLPHIIASLVTFADKTYIKFYRKHIIIGLPILLLFVVIIFYLNQTLALVIYFVTTMYHAIRQQTGIASMLSRIKGILFYCWSWALIIASGILLVLIFMPDTFNWNQIKLLSLIALFFIVVGLILSFIYAWKAKTVIGRWYVIATSLMIVCAYFFAINDYIFFTIFVVRFVHDITAFSFYVTHDINRNSDSTHNFIYATINKIKLPLLFLVPLTSVVIALLVRYGFELIDLAFIVLIMLSFVHYYVEAIMWRRDSIHRQQIIMQ
jgi:hypothetical protein